MKIRRLLLTISTFAILVACSAQSGTESSSLITSIQDSSISSVDEVTSSSVESELSSSSSFSQTSSESGVSTYSQSSSIESREVSSEESSVSSSQESQESSSSVISSVSSSSISSVASETDPEEVMLPIGNKTVSCPENKSNKEDFTNWKEYTFNGSLPEYWSAISGNNKVNNGSFYADGSYKFSHLYYGLQTPMFNSWKKIEIRFTISQVNNSSDKKKDGQPIFHVYGYNENGSYISTDYIEQGEIEAKTTSVHFYIRNENISYLEFRLNANPYKGSQCYNFGVSKISFKGWDYD